MNEKQKRVPRPILPGRRRVLGWAAAVAALAGLALTLGVAAPSVSAQETAAPSEQEQAAINVVKEWFAAWQQGDEQKMASLMADDVEFRGIPNQPLRKGRDAFLKNTGRFIKLKPQVDVTEAVAIGGKTGTAVLTKRVDKIHLNGQDRTVPLAAFFRVRDGKILEWLDMPLVPLGPPPGARRGGNGATASGNGGE